jgi:hypothetical protein
MFKDSLGNSYAKLPTKPPKHTAKSSKGGKGKIGRSKRNADWITKVKTRERAHRERGQKFDSYPC